MRLKSVKAGDMVPMPDLTSGVIDPFWQTTTLSFIGTTLEAYLRGTGLASESRWGPEFEFLCLRRRGAVRNRPHPYEIALYFDV